MTQTPETPNTVEELLNLQTQKQEGVSPEQVLEVVEQLNPVQTIHLTRFLLKRLENFHWGVVEEINNGECDQPLQPWVHDSTLLSNIALMFNNMTDFQD